MKKYARLFISINFFLLLFIVWSFKEKTADTTVLFNLKTVATRNTNCTLLATGKIFQQPVLNIRPVKDNKGVTIWKKGDPGDWSKATYLVAELYGFDDYSGVIDVEFFKESGSITSEKIVVQGGQTAGSATETPWLSCLIGTLPKIKTKLIFPLSYLDAQRLFLPRYPRQLKGTVNGNRLDPADITKVVLRVGPYAAPYYTPVFELAGISLLDKEPEPYAAVEEKAVDQFGQWNLKDWPGKVKTEAELIDQNKALTQQAGNAAYPEDWSRWGGWKAKQFKATGFFRTEFDGKRWWLADPDGYAFLSVGVDGMRLTSGGPVKGIEDIFQWLPQQQDTAFAEVLNNERGSKSMDFYKANLMRVYGNAYKQQWGVSAAGLMRSLRLNTVGNWSDLTFAKENKLPYVFPMRDFPSSKTLLYRDFPDVFSDEYAVNAGAFAKQLESMSDDPYMVGYFLRNEPEWAFGYHNLAYEMFGTAQPSATKQEFISWIAKQYKNDIQALNSAWNTILKDFTSLAEQTFKQYPSKAADKDFYDFSVIMVKRYIDLPCDAVKKIDSHHLNLGMRYAWLSSDLLYKAGERFDVFSINGYGINPPATAEIARISGKPVMIGEFHHGAVDRGLPGTGIIGVLSQQDRADAYRNYIEQGFARPELIGMHYFQWVDQPFYGRFDGENYNIGVVSITNQPYPELTSGMLKTHTIMYKVATGATAPYKAHLTEVPAIHY